MKNNYTSLKSPLDEEDELKTDHEIDLEKGPLPEYDSEEEGALPPYSDHALVNNPPNTHRENNPSRSTDNSSPFLIKLLISFTPIYVLNVLAICYLTYKDAFFKDYGAAEWTLFGFWCLVCTLALIFLTYFYETWVKAVKVTVISLAKCVKVISIGLFNIRREMMIIIWILWLIICCILFVYIKSGDLILNKALICSTCTISAVLLLIVSSVCIPFWTFERTLAKLAKVLLLQSGIVLVLNGTMFLRGKHFERIGCEIEASVLFIMGNVLFLCEMECPGALIRTRNSIRNGIAFILGGIGNAMMGLANAIRGANDNNDIPLGEMDVESEV
ncbi:wtf meiotic drive antidote-like Wtf21 [Schizosaccharomyces pombe]|uniref:Meiotic drive suppressor wtf21 n=1 Tax=Schizosaccharomyces pombe (strain 972 / ATCC 24843) TaxID=284812 RepID=WTF21_SCHPO|nr:wtf element Wtf21 [Schizosaccharomyces pombe]O74474.1 RecName: Full=Meiotic drive suppressor wtf21 [Schizosaccharomyces pombe 972h-]CAA20789.1 wtf element Wtf21 [Schizosaccharomyces pombe]|eukprot:NP_588423.1 wtf element Wtf21 [Schizosaccharomyces pombe]